MFLFFLLEMRLVQFGVFVFQVTYASPSFCPATTALNSWTYINSGTDSTCFDDNQKNIKQNIQRTWDTLIVMISMMIKLSYQHQTFLSWSTSFDSWAIQVSFLSFDVVVLTLQSWLQSLMSLCPVLMMLFLTKREMQEVWHTINVNNNTFENRK